MAQVELIMPKMGESIMEATILQWVKKVGEKIELDETVLEISTDKVDSEVPSPVEGKLVKILYQENDVVAIGQPVAIIEAEGVEDHRTQPLVIEEIEAAASSPKETMVEIPKSTANPSYSAEPQKSNGSGSEVFYSPLVRNMAKKEGISNEELDGIEGTGKDGRVTKKDMRAYITNRKNLKKPTSEVQTKPTKPPTPETETTPTIQYSEPSDNVEIVEMDRMRKLIAKHMVESKRTSPHVTSFIEVDVTPIVEWRNGIKNDFLGKYGQKITFTPVFIDAVVKGIQAYPRINCSVEGDNIVLKKYVNIGMATAMESGNLIVPVIKNADYLNLVGLAKTVNDLAARARANELNPDEIQGGTFTLTNVGTFGSMMGTPIINQPQVAILAVGAIRKKPVVLETENGDVIGIRHMMIMSLSYDHRVVDGSLGSMFLKKVADILEAFQPPQEI
ncbi:MAG: 2-oxo acid dehydrogenase subunit E2 [Bacteroidia bacterium]|nr:2-oxo acid dehydrogenase subunit E2 [Bacteroidia bacterium]